MQDLEPLFYLYSNENQYKTTSLALSTVMGSCPQTPLEEHAPFLTRPPSSQLAPTPLHCDGLSALLSLRLRSRLYLHVQDLSCNVLSCLGTRQIFPNGVSIATLCTCTILSMVEPNEVDILRYLMSWTRTVVFQ